MKKLRRIRRIGDPSKETKPKSEASKRSKKKYLQSEKGKAASKRNRKKWRESHKEQRREYAKEYREKNREKYKEYNRKWAREHYQSLQQYPHLSKTGIIGAIGELQVCSDLLIKGYEVFRSVSPHCTCDLVACKDGKCYRIEVKTGVQYETGRIDYPKIDYKKADIGAIALKDQIIYVPAL